MAPHTAEHACVPQAGASSEAGDATPERVRADAATPTHTGDTLHMHSVAHTAKPQAPPEANECAPPDQGHAGMPRTRQGTSRTRSTRAQPHPATSPMVKLK